MEPNDTFSEQLIREIEARGAIPTPKWKFFITRGVVWFLAIISVLIGGIAFAIGEFVFIDNDGISKFQNSSIQDMVQSIPFVWLAVLAFFTASAYYGFRHTRRGYKYAAIGVVMVVIVLSITLGFILNAFDFGQNIHKISTGISVSD